MLLAENAALSAHGFICEDGPELPKEEGQEAAQEDGAVLEATYSPGCEPLDQARIPASSGMDKKIQEGREAEYRVGSRGNEF
jgi:hypothetical protein